MSQSIVLTIDSALQSLIPALSESEDALLTEQILAQGCLQALCVWKTEDDQRILLDGHNRYRICTENKKSYQTVNLKLDSREHAKLWILAHQAGRRNLTDDQRAVIWNDIREQRSKIEMSERAAKARSTQLGLSVNSTEEPVTPKDTRKAIAIESKVPESKLRKLAALKKSNPKIYEEVRTGKVTLREIKPKPTTPAKQELRARYSEKDFYRRIGTGLAGSFSSVEDRLDELTHIKRADWSPAAEEGLRNLIKNLNEIAERADDYASQFKLILKSNKKVA